MAYISASPLSKVLHANPSFPSVSFNDCKSGFVHTLHTARTFVSAVPFPAARHSTRSLKCVARAAVQESRDALKVDQIRAVGSDRRQVYTVQIQKPLGIVFREDKEEGRIVVDELVVGGNASQSIIPISVGDCLMATTAEALQLGTTKTQTIMFKTEGEDFDTVIKAIQSNTCARCLITMVMEKGGSK